MILKEKQEKKPGPRKRGPLRTRLTFCSSKTYPPSSDLLRGSDAYREETASLALLASSETVCRFYSREQAILHTLLVLPACFSHVKFSQPLAIQPLR